MKVIRWSLTTGRTTRCLFSTSILTSNIQRSTLYRSIAMSHKAQKQDTHGKHSKRRWIKDHLIASVKDVLSRPVSRAPSPSPGSVMERAETLIAQAPPGAPISTSIGMYPLSPIYNASILTFSGSQGLGSSVVTSAEEAASHPDPHVANVPLVMTNHAGIGKYINALGLHRV